MNSRHRNTDSGYRFRRASQRLGFGADVTYLASFIVALIVVIGCDGSIKMPTGSAENIEPGVLYTVSIEPLPPPPATNLIENGDFAAWQPGAAAPDFFLPPDPGRNASTIAPVDIDSEDGKAVEQTWTSSDALEAYTAVFRCWLDDLRPNATYRFTARVNNPSPNELLLRAFHYNVRSPAEAELMEGKPTLLGGISIPPTTGFQSIDFTFTTGPEPEFCVLLAVKYNSPDATLPGTSIWDEWFLEEVAGGPTQ